jgi:Mg2+ and Co2+ transporter CorA
MTLSDIITTIERDWPLLVFVFAAGGIWWQGKSWFNRIEESLNREGREHHTHSVMLQTIHDKMENLDDRTTKIEDTVTRIHEELHEQEIKLAVLETSKGQRR